MQLIVAAVGNRMPRWVDTAFDEYARRMPPDLRIELREVKPEPRTSGRTAEAIRALEAERIRAVLPKRARIVSLDERGRDLTTLQLADQLQRWRGAGDDVALIIGGPDGLDSALKAEASELIRLSSLTLAHGLVRVLLAEQLYRAWSITQNHPYHRA